jgi:hypothetical protein
LKTEILKFKDKSIANKDLLAILYLILLITINSVISWTILHLDNPFFWWAIQFLTIYYLVKLKKKITSPQIENNQLIVKIYLCWIIICIIRGVFIAENYWEWKNLIGTSLMLLLPLLSYLPNSLTTIKLILHTWFKYGLIMFFCFLPFLFADGVGKFLVPFSFLIFFLPCLKTKWKIITIILSIFAAFYDISSRSTLIKFIVPLLILSLYYTRNQISKNILNILRLILLITPIALFFLGVTGIFNIFKLNEIVGDLNVHNTNSNTTESEVNFTTDTRTFLYIEVIESALKNNYIIFGRTPARGNDSMSFGDYNKEILHTGKMERFSNEVSILNIFTWLGIVGVVIYFIIFFKSSYLAINESNNIFIKLIGVNISFRWLYSFIEDFSNFDLSNVFLWLMIGMCFSKTFRKMSNNQMKDWVLGIFDFQSKISSKKLKYKYER